MEFFHRASGNPSRVAVFPGSFNPVTVAHLAVARAALSKAEEVVLVLPRMFPHKEYSGVGFDERMAILCAAVSQHNGISAAASDHGLFVEIAAECREVYGPDVALSFVCGRDAAERIAGWDYGRPEAFAGMLREFGLLVAARGGEYEPPAEFQSAIDRLDTGCDLDMVSASEVRARIARGESWEHLVPAAIRELVRATYR